MKVVQQTPNILLIRQKIIKNVHQKILF